MGNDLDSTIDRLFQTLNSISSINSENILKKLRIDLDRLKKYLPGPVTFEKYVGLDKNPPIDAMIYGKLVEKIVRNFDNNFPMIADRVDPMIENLIVVDGSTFLMFFEILYILTDALKRSENVKVTNSLVILLEKLMKSDSLFSVITDICKANKSSAMEREELENKWRNILQLLVSLPNRIANKLDGKVPNTFLPAIYANILCFHIAKSIEFFDSNVAKLGFEPDVKMISMLISKAFVTLGSWRFENLIDIFSAWCSGNSDGTKNLVQKILSHIDRPAVEPIAVLFLKRSDPAPVILAAFGNLLTNPHWKHAFTVKIPFMTFYEDENLVKNLIDYLSSMTKEERILPDLVIKLLDIWSDRSALNHTSLEQHEYITKLILMSMRKIKKILTRSEKEEITRLLFSGTAAHLESTQSEVRGIGMITGETVIEILNDSEDEPKLKYDYEGMPEKTRDIVVKLRNLNNVSDEAKNLSEKENNLVVGEISFGTLGAKKIYELAIDCEIVTKKSIESKDSSKNTTKSESRKEIAESPKIEQNSEQDSDDILDSDDDLVPYDMSNDTPISEKLRPTYLRDMRDNLLNAQSNSDPNIFAESMRVAEDLISSQLPNDDSRFAVELLEIFVTLREISYMEDFEISKYKACIAIVMVFPKESAKYLCNEFHTKIGQYSVKDRLFILDILGQSAQKLSKIEAKVKNSQVKTNESKNQIRPKVSKPISLAIDTSNSKKYETLYDDDFEVMADSGNSTNNWQEIVAKRIETNTRCFAHPTKLPSTTINKFNDVASSFFYPLLYGFRREGTCMYKTPKAIEDQEHILLVNYLKTLSKIMMAAENCILAPKMGKDIMELAWSLRYHSQAKVRLCIIENIASVVITLPKEGLTGELMDLIFEFRAWLSDVSDDGIRGDPDTKCRNLGKNVVALIDSIYCSTLREWST